MISTRRAPLALAAGRRGVFLARRCRQKQEARTAVAVAASQRRWESPVARRPFQAAGGETHDELLQLEDEYSTLKVNWFPGHMVKATKVIREKLKQVDMVFEVRDARIPFTSANDDLDKIVGPSKARLIVLNKADLSNQALEQRVLQRFREQGKTAVYACGRTGSNVNKLLAWARERGSRRGEFATTGAVAMVVGMPNVGKSSLINLLRGKATSRGKGAGGGGAGEGAKQVARVGAMPGVTRQVSAFRIASTPPLYLVDTPGVMVPRVERVTAGLRLALTRAVPDAVVPPDILVRFMLRVVRSRRLLGAQKSQRAPPPSPSRSTPGAGRRPRQQQPRRSKAIAAWLSSLDARAAAEPTGASRPTLGGGDDEERTAATERRQEEEEDEEDEDMEALLEAVERESGAEGKPAPEARRICCRFLLDAFRDGQFGRITLDSVPRARSTREASSCSSSSSESHAGWAEALAGQSGERASTGSRGGHSGRPARAGRRRPPSSSPAAEDGLSERLVRDWSSPDAWEGAETGQR